MAKPSKPVTPASKPVARTEVRNSPIPQVAPPPRPTAVPKATTSPPRAAAAPQAVPQSKPAAAATSRPVTHELIARRAYEIWASGQGGSELENWTRAERELRGM